MGSQRVADVRVQDEPSRRRGLALRKAGREIPPSAADAHLSRVALILIAAAGAVLAWSRFMMLTQSLSGDEVFSIVRYVQPGPSGIWNAATWLPNDHMLFELLTWITTHVLGSRHEPVYRLWGVFPAIAAAALLTWWLWTRREPLAAALFAAFASVAPMLLDLGTQARGYGLTFLAGALVLVGADRLQRSEEHGLLLFSVGGLIGMLTLENFVGLFVGSALALMLRPALRRRVLFAVILTGLLTAAWYAPVLSKSFGYENPHGHPLPWYGFVQAPLRDLLGAQLNLLVPSLPVTAGAAIAAGVLLLGAVTCWLRWERMLALLTLVPCLTAYLLLEAARAKYAPRFGSFTLPPLLVLAALGLADLVRYLCRTPQMQRVLLGLVAICLAVVLARFMNFAASFAATPYEAAKSAGQIITGLEASDPRLQVVSNVDLGAFDFYAAPTRVRTLAPASLIRLFCARGAPFVYLQNGVTPRLPSTTCLTERGAFQIQLRERRAPESLWIVPG